MRWLLLLLLALAAPATAQTFPKLTGRVVDDAHVLSPDQVGQLTQLSAATEQASTRQLVVATVASLGGDDIDDYGTKLGRAWNIGQKGSNNGAILIVAPAERKVRIEVGYGLEPILTDALTGRLVDGVRNLGDLLFGPGPGLENPDLRAVARGHPPARPPGAAP